MTLRRKAFRLVEVLVTGVRKHKCEGTIVLKVPQDASNDEVRQFLEDHYLEEGLPEPLSWSWEGNHEDDCEYEVDHEEVPALRGAASSEVDADAVLVRDKDGDLFLEEDEE